MVGSLLNDLITCLTDLDGKIFLMNSRQAKIREAISGPGPLFGTLSWFSMIFQVEKRGFTLWVVSCFPPK